MIIRLLSVLLCCAAAAKASVPNSAPVDLLIIVGAYGEKQFAEEFKETVHDWINACREANRSFRIIESADGDTNQISEVRAVLSAQPPSEHELWMVLIGHGTFDGKESKFNLNGPDLSAQELSMLLNAIERPVILINTSSSSAPFINALSHANRIVITATKSGWEENYARFGKFLAKAITDAASDLDRDGQVSLLEAFLMASRQVEDFYKNERRLATEHALIDDNGDGRGTPATFYRGVRPAKKAEDAVQVDGFRAHQIHFLPSEWEAKLSPEVRKKRNELEMALELARARKESLSEEEYLKQIEPILIEISRLYRDAAADAKDAE